MPRTCKCGGRLVPVWYRLNREGISATFKCDGCGIVRVQKKRQPKPKDTV